MNSHNKSDIPTFLDNAMPAWHSYIETAVDTTDTITGTQGFALLGPSYEPAAVSLSKVIGQIRGGISPSEVYQRPFKSFWLTLQRGGSIDDALGSGVDRIRTMVDADIDRASDYARLEKFANENRIVGYSRVLVGAVNCALCIVASTQLYHSRSLKPIHPRCDCGVAPVLSHEFDGDHILNQDLLDQIHRDIQQKFGTSDRSGRSIDYRKILSIHEHGEMGPMLTWRGDSFTGPNDLH